MPFDRWTFHDFIEQIIMLDEVQEIPGTEEARFNLIVEAWKRFPNDCAKVNMIKAENFIWRE